MTLRAAFEVQAGNNARLGSPFTARILRLLAQNLAPGTPLTDRMFAWEGDTGGFGQSLPLRLLAGLHALVLTGECPALAAAYPPHEAPDDARLWGAIDTALTQHATTLDHWLDSPPQTNEVRRAAVLIAAGHWLAAHYGLPLRVLELGASGGLNLMWDRFALIAGETRLGPKEAALELAPDWQGDAPTGTAPMILDRRGVDLLPINARTAEGALRLTSYLWADQPERLTRTRAAIACFDAVVDQGDAADWLETQLEQAGPDHLTLVYHTIAWQYFPAETQARCRAAISAAGCRGPMAHLAMEADGQSENGAALSLMLAPEGREIALGRADFHGRWVRWQAP